MPVNPIAPLPGPRAPEPAAPGGRQAEVAETTTAFAALLALMMGQPGQVPPPVLPESEPGGGTPAPDQQAAQAPAALPVALAAGPVAGGPAAGSSAPDWSPAGPTVQPARPLPGAAVVAPDTAQAGQRVSTAQPVAAAATVRAVGPGPLPESPLPPATAPAEAQRPWPVSPAVSPEESGEPDQAEPATVFPEAAPGLPPAEAFPYRLDPIAQPEAQSAPLRPAVPDSPGPLPPADLMEQVARTAIQSEDGTYTLTLRLHPEHLGEVRLEVRVDGREVRTVFQVASPEVRQVLEAHGGQLRQSLLDAGLTLSGFNVNTGSGERQPWEREAVAQALMRNRRQPRQPSAVAAADLQRIRRFTTTLASGGLDTIA